MIAAHTQDFRNGELRYFAKSASVGGLMQRLWRVGCSKWVGFENRQLSFLNVQIDSLATFGDLDSILLDAT